MLPKYFIYQKKSCTIPCCTIPSKIAKMLSNRQIWSHCWLYSCIIFYFMCQVTISPEFICLWFRLPTNIFICLCICQLAHLFVLCLQFCPFVCLLSINYGAWALTTHGKATTFVIVFFVSLLVLKDKQSTPCSVTRQAEW